MKEKEIVNAIKQHVNRQNNGWKFIYGRQAVGKQQFLTKLDHDKKFRKTIVEMVVTLSVDILTRKPKRR